MFIAIISDIHNNEVNLQKILNYCKDNNIKNIICCGDLASDETLEFLNNNYNGAIYYTFGNMDDEQLKDYKDVEKYKNTVLYKDFGEIEIDGKKIAFVHYPKEAKKLCETGKYNFVFYGHTHKPWEEIIGHCKMLNPGNVTGDFYPPTFAVWDTKNDSFELIRVHDLK